MVGTEVDKNKIVVVLRCVPNKVALSWKLYVVCCIICCYQYQLGIELLNIPWVNKITSLECFDL